MDQNKTGKYLKYAIGEIVLVMIGILLALQVNTWNEYRKNNIQEQQILSQLKDEYTANLLQLEQKIAHRKKMIAAANKVLQYIDEPANVNSDSLINELNIYIGTPTIEPIENNLINSGDINLIRNKKLKQLLIHWPSDVLGVQEIEQIWFTRMWESIVPMFTEFGILRSGFFTWWNDEHNLKWLKESTNVNPFQKPKSNKALKVDKILRSKELEGLTSLVISVNYSANFQSQALHKRILEILDLLGQEIKE
jgi:type II secretory pathway pseudopilin PulG